MLAAEYAGFCACLPGELAQLVREMGFRGRAVAKTYKGKSSVLLKGQAGFRPNLTGTRYAASNPKIVADSIGRVGQTASAIRTTVIGFILAAGIEVIESILNDRSTLAAFLGSLVTELAKVGLSSLVAATVTLAVGKVVTLVALPVVVGICIGVLVSMGLNWLDREFSITQRMIAVMQEFIDTTAGETASLSAQTERWLIDRALRRAGISY